MRIFWSSIRHLERCRAEEDLRSVQVALVAASSSQGGEAVQMFKDFNSQMNEVLETPLLFKEEEVYSSKDDILKLVNL